MSMRRPFCLTTFVLLTNVVLVLSQTNHHLPPSRDFVGGVYVMSNDFDNNSIIAFGRRSNGTLESLGSFRTGGQGSTIDDGEGLDSLFPAYSVILTPDNRFLVTVNPGSSSIAVFKVLRNFRLRLRSIRRVSGIGPLSVAFSNGIVYAASLEADRVLEEDFTDFGLKGALTGFKLTRSGRLRPIRRSVRRLLNRPSAIQFTPDGRSLVVSSLAAGSPDLDTTRVDEISVFRVLRGGLLSAKPIDTATSTLPNNAEGRSLPSAIGFETVSVDGSQFVVVPEPRFLSGNGVGFEQQVSSISTWRITREQSLVAEQLELTVGTSLESGQEASCWIEFSKNKEYFWVANTVSETISAFSFKEGKATLVQEVASTAPSPIDLWLSSDGKYLYQLGVGFVDIFEVEDGGFGPGLTRIQTIDGLPQPNAVGIVAI